MLELKLLNSNILNALSNLGHMDEIIICDAGFPIPTEVPTIDISITDNVPTITELLKVILPYFSVEKLIIANECQEHNPRYVKRIIELLGSDIEFEKMPHTNFKKRSITVKGIIRTGDFTAWGNILLVSGAGTKWIKEI